MNTSTTFLKHTAEHFYLGILVTAVYVAVAPLLLAQALPGISALLFVEILVLSPIIMIHLLVIARRRNHSWSLQNVVLYRESIGGRRFSLWFVLGLIAIFGTFIPLYPLGIHLREAMFAWLPEWYFNPAYGATSADVLANLFLAAIVIDGIIAPTMEEIFFRGYLLPRMDYLKQWAPVVNGAFFGLYHFWQPHNLVTLVIIGILLSYIVWKTKNVYLGIALHCTINVVGAAGGYFAVVNGIEIVR